MQNGLLTRITTRMKATRRKSLSRYVKIFLLRGDMEAKKLLRRRSRLVKRWGLRLVKRRGLRLVKRWRLMLGTTTKSGSKPKAFLLPTSSLQSPPFMHQTTQRRVPGVLNIFDFVLIENLSRRKRRVVEMKANMARMKDANAPTSINICMKSESTIFSSSMFRYWLWGWRMLIPQPPSNLNSDNASFAPSKKNCTIDFDFED